MLRLDYESRRNTAYSQPVFPDQCGHSTDILIVRFFFEASRGTGQPYEFIPPMTAQRELLLAKMQEFDALLQAMVRVRSEIYSIVAAMPDGEKPEEIGIPLTFYESGHIIAWGDDSEHFRPSTFRLLQQLWLAPDHTLSKEDVRQDVNEDEYASDTAIRTVIKKARRELACVEFPYEIETIPAKGYRLIGWTQTCPNEDTPGHT